MTPGLITGLALGVAAAVVHYDALPRTVAATEAADA
jgi:hypothetical protein